MDTTDWFTFRGYQRLVRRTIDIEIAFFDSAEVFEPYLLAIANRGFLYVNEVNP